VTRKQQPGGPRSANLALLSVSSLSRTAAITREETRRFGRSPLSCAWTAVFSVERYCAAMSQENIEIIRRAHEAYERGDWAESVKDFDSEAIAYREVPDGANALERLEHLRVDLLG
jgi:hypothetical protein